MAHDERAARSAHERWRGGLTIAAALPILALAWWLRSPLHDLPLERDEGAYATIAARWLAGDALYRDLFDHKPPLVYMVFGMARLLGDEPVRAIRTLATLYLLAGASALFALAWRLYGRWAALAALPVFLAYASSLRFQGLTFNSEAVLALPATLGCLLATSAMRARRASLLALAGVCVGLAIAAKPVGASLLAPLLLASLLLGWPPWRRWAGAGLALGGAALPLLGLGLLLWRQGALAAAYEALVSYNRLYAVESLAQGWDPLWLWRIWAPMLALGLPGLAGLAAAAGWREWRTPAHGIAALWGLMLLATALLSLRSYPHYYLAAVPLLSLWAGAGLAAAGRLIGGARLRPLALPLGLALLAALLAPPLREIWPLRAQSPEQQIGALYGPDGDKYFGPAAEVAGYVARRGPPGQPIFVWAAEPEIYYLAQRRPATRFVYDYPLDRLPGAREQALGALRAAPPPLIITYHDVRPLGFHPFMFDYAYELSATIGGYDLYELPQAAR